LLLTACPRASGPGGAPRITSFTANPPTISAPGQPVALSWQISGAVTELELSGGVGAVSGTSTVVFPDATTTYTLTASNSAGSAEATAKVTLGAGGGPLLEDGRPPVGTFGVSLTQSDFQSDQEGDITRPDDPRIVRVAPGDTFYALVSYADPGGIAGVRLRLANRNPPGLAADLVEGQAVAGFTLSGEVGGCVLDGSQATVSCIYEIAVGDIPNIDALPGAGDEFAYVFRTNVVDAAGNESDAPPRGYVIVDPAVAGAAARPVTATRWRRLPAARTAVSERGISVKFSALESSRPGR
jgi:hypothetical protein